jgi:hypothetical protein
LQFISAVIALGRGPRWLLGKEKFFDLGEHGFALWSKSGMWYLYAGFGPLAQHWGMGNPKKIRVFRCLRPLLGRPRQLNPATMNKATGPYHDKLAREAG